jgi:cation diffusion facilitator family transporter
LEREREKQRVATLSVISNASLVAGKLLVGLLTGSVSVVSEAIHSAVDLVAAAIALFSVRRSSKPADHDHPYGHGKIENISGLVEALLIFVAAGWVIYEAVHKLIRPTPLDHPWLGVIVMAASSAVNIVVSRRLFRVARLTESIALEADAWHLRTDVYTSAGVMVGLGALWVGNALWPTLSLQWIDPVTAIGVALLIVHAAYELTVKAGRDLLDERLPAEEEAWIEGCIREQAVLGFHRLRTRRAGVARFVDVHVQVPGDMTVDDSHAIADSIEAKLRDRFPGISATVHIEPRTRRESITD